MPVSGISNAVELASGHYHTCARLATGDIACWGYNSSGQLGDGSDTNRATPVMVLGFPSVTPAGATATPTPTPTNTPTSTATGTPTATPTATATSSGSSPEVDAFSTGDTRPTTFTIQHTTSGSDRLMLVGVSIDNDDSETVSSVTYNGVGLSFVGAQNSVDDARVEIWSLVAPSTGTHDVVITFSAPLRRSGHAGVMTFTGVHQTTPLGAFASNFAQSDPGPATVDVSSGANELVFDTVGCESCSSLTVGGGQTERWNLSINHGGTMIYGAGSTEPGAATVTMSWTLGSSDHWAIGGVSIKPSGGSAPQVDATSSASIERTSLTISHTTSGIDRLMLVGVSLNNELYETVSSVTYNGAPLSFVGTASNDDDSRSEIWSLVAPETGTHDVVITFSANLRRGAKAGVATFTGVNQGTPLGTFQSNIGTQSTPATVTVNSASNELVFDVLTCETCGSITPDGSQAERWNFSDTESGPEWFSGASTKPGATSVIMSWAIGDIVSMSYWAIGAVPIKPP